MDNCISSTKILLDLISIKHTSLYLEDQILSHPYHPSILAITDTLNKYEIENLVIKTDYDKLEGLPLPCIVHLSDGGGLFQVLTELSKDKVVYVNDKGRPIELLKENFIGRWTGICLLAQATENSREPGIKKKLQEKRSMAFLIWITLVLMLIAIVPIIVKSPFLEDYPAHFLEVFVVLKLVGLTVGAMLLWYEVDQYNPILQSFCSGGKKVNCDSVLDSKYARIFNGTLSLNLVAFSYFFGTLTYFLINGLSFSAMSLLSFFSFLAMPALIIGFCRSSL